MIYTIVNAVMALVLLWVPSTTGVVTVTGIATATQVAVV
jgi:hypothetical protein